MGDLNCEDLVFLLVQARLYVKESHGVGLTCAYRKRNREKAIANMAKSDVLWTLSSFAMTTHFALRSADSMCRNIGFLFGSKCMTPM